MANLISGSTNGRFPELPDYSFVSNTNLRYLSSGNTSSANFKEKQFRKIAASSRDSPVILPGYPKVISLLINNACNLKCKHCYLEASKFGKYLTHNEWMSAFKNIFFEIKPMVLCFVGKEVFLNEKSAAIMFDAIKLRDEIQRSDEKKTEIGVISNGTLIHHHQDSLPNTYPDYFDISIDGLPEIHDDIRGAGAFAQLEPNLKWLVKRFPGKVWIVNTMLASNMNSLPEFIQYYHQNYDLDRFSIGFYKPQYFTDQSLKLTVDHYHQIANHILPQLEALQLKRPLQLIMEFDQTENTLIDILAANGWANPLDKISSVAHEYDNGLTLRINTAKVPIGLWRSARITPEGYWLAAKDIMNVKAYDEVNLGSVRDCNFDITQLCPNDVDKIQRFEIQKK